MKLNIFDFLKFG